MFPPKSGRKAVRLRNANTIMTLSHVYQDLTSAWINDRQMFPKDRTQPEPTFADQIPQLRDRVLGVAAQLQALRVQTMIAKFEGNFRGKWPMEEYIGLVDTQTGMLISLTLVRWLQIVAVIELMSLSARKCTRTTRPKQARLISAPYPVRQPQLCTHFP